MPKTRIAGVEIYHREKGQGAPVLFVPGLGLDGGIFEETAALLPEGYRAVFIDQRGSGRSDAPRSPYSIEIMAEDLRGVMLDLDIEKAVIVGHSMGGYVALQAALENPELVLGLVLVGTSAVGVPAHLGTLPSARAVLGRTRGTLEQLVRANIDVGLGSRIKRDPERVDRFVAARLEAPHRGRGVEGQRGATLTFDVRDRLWEIGCPAVVIHGLEDPIIPAQRGRELAEGIEAAALEELEGVGHFPPLEAPETIGAAVRKIWRGEGALEKPGDSL